MATDPARCVVPPDATIETDLDESPATLPDGRTLDEDAARKLTAETLEEVRRRNLIPGRKSLSGNDVHSPRVQYRVPESVMEQARKRAEREGVSVHALARKALERYLAS
jgi:hypothetical protein